MIISRSTLVGFYSLLLSAKSITATTTSPATTATTTTTTTPYAGTSKWYVDYENQRCKMDCAESAGGECSGITSNTNLDFYDTARLCCSNKLGYLDVDFCADRSLKTPLGTEKFYAVSPDGYCLQDVDPADGATAVDKLYVDAETCCSGALGWVNSDFCVSRSTGGDGYTNMWSVDYQNMVCNKDCAADDCPVAANSPCGGAPTDYSMQLFDDAATCCSTKLGWVQADTCTTTSETGTASTTGTLKFYVDYTVGTCKKDCPVSDTSPECGGVLTNSVGETLFPTAAACCSAKFGWIDTDLCEAMVTKGYTDKYYVSYSDNACKRDCKTTSSPECGGNPTDLATQLFTTAAECCSKKLSWVNSASCITKSETGSEAAATGSLKWYVDWSISKCVKDCPVGATDTECGGLAEKWESAEYTTGAECCKQRLSWVAPADCMLV
eukprot:CCRYP_008477-RB/>CCRYP_008477-RB protein AED:0.31 eAED:0.31 QI:0/0/0/1/0.5/0.33/3/0/438